jgi:uncharacterized protein YaaQ
MKMVMAIIHRDDEDRVLGALVDAGYTATYGDSRGGVLRRSQKTLFIAVEREKLEEVLSILRTSCRSCLDTGEGSRNRVAFGPIPATPEVGGSVVFVWDLERFEKY